LQKIEKKAKITGRKTGEILGPVSHIAASNFNPITGKLVNKHNYHYLLLI